MSVINKIKQAENKATSYIKKVKKEEEDIIADIKSNQEKEIISFSDEMKEKNKKRLEENKKKLESIKKETAEKLEIEIQQLLSRMEKNKEEAECFIKKVIKEMINGNS